MNHCTHTFTHVLALTLLALSAIACSPQSSDPVEPVPGADTTKHDTIPTPKPDTIPTPRTDSTEWASEAMAKMGLGWNLGNTLDSYNDYLPYGSAVNKYETAWGQPVTTQALIQYLHNGGFNTIRIPVTWYQNMDSAGIVRDVWMNRVEEIVDWVLAEGMYCILNVHHDTGDHDNAWLCADFSNAEAVKARFAVLWQQIATRFEDKNDHLLFEAYNEILDPLHTWNAPKSFGAQKTVDAIAQTFVDVVRQTGGNNLTRNLIITTYAAAVPGVKTLTMPADTLPNHQIMEFHHYAPWGWDDDHGKWNNTAKTQFQNDMSVIETYALDRGIPVLLGEYAALWYDGHHNELSDADREEAAAYAAYVVSECKKRGVATVYWMGLIDGQDRSVPQWTMPKTVQAMVNAYNQ